jgi:molybdopterin synthase sulfur carrier subunit
MPKVVFTSQLQRHVPSPTCDVEGDTVRAALDAVFAEHRALRGYVLDDQGSLRKHVVVFIDGTRVQDRERLSDAVRPDSEIHVLQALTGG